MLRDGRWDTPRCARKSLLSAVCLALHDPANHRPTHSNVGRKKSHFFRPDLYLESLTSTDPKPVFVNKLHASLGSLFYVILRQQDIKCDLLVSLLNYMQQLQKLNELY